MLAARGGQIAPGSGEGPSSRGLAHQFDTVRSEQDMVPLTDADPGLDEEPCQRHSTERARRAAERPLSLGRRGRRGGTRPRGLQQRRHDGKFGYHRHRQRDAESGAASSAAATASASAVRRGPAGRFRRSRRRTRAVSWRSCPPRSRRPTTATRPRSHPRRGRTGSRATRVRTRWPSSGIRRSTLSS